VKNACGAGDLRVSRRRQVFVFAGFRTGRGEKLAIPRARARGEFPPARGRDSLAGRAGEDDAMRPKSPAEDRDEDLFRSRLASILDPRHELLRLAALIDWAAFDAAFGALYAEAGRPGLPTRLMAGLHLLKHAKGLSDEQVCAQWVENPYFQAFCGEAWFRHRLPLDRSSMTRWRRRIGPERLEALLAETDPPPLKWSASKYGFEPEEDRDGEQEAQA
jgi:Transposase domain (DUF772)